MKYMGRLIGLGSLCVTPGSINQFGRDNESKSAAPIHSAES